MVMAVGLIILVFVMVVTAAAGVSRVVMMMIGVGMRFEPGVVVMIVAAATGCMSRWGWVVAFGLVAS